MKTSQITNYQPLVEPTSEELQSLSLACSRLWDLDTNRLVPDVDYHIDLQLGKNMYDSTDTASAPLFSFVDEKALERPTYRSFIKLFDNYAENVGVSESVTDEEMAENMVQSVPLYPPFF